jgi:leucyl aminopeptidase
VTSADQTLSFDVAARAPRSVAAVIVPVFADGPVPRGVGLARAALAALGFESKPTQTLVIPAGSGPVVIVVGLGDRKKVSANGLRNAAAAATRAALRFESVSVGLADIDGVGAAAAGQAVAEGMLLASYRFTRHRSKVDSSGRSLKTVTLTATPNRAAGVRRGVTRGAAIGNAVRFARDLINTSPGHLNATDIADVAVQVGIESKLAVTVHDLDAIREMKLGGLVGVNKGSVEPARLIRLEYKARNATSTVALIGKGVMYDSGGISLKPSDVMHASMKMDMSGAAAVLAAMSVLHVVKPSVNVVAYLCCTDNMPSGSALKMGEVITIRNGKTVEIHNTDAEGRLILADGLSLAVEEKVDAIVDIATLTGACISALGTRYAGLFSNSDKWAAQLDAASKRADENLWRLPLVPEYRRNLDSEVADMKNVGGPYGGAITAALFLQEFVGDIPWAHIDMAGPMRSDAEDGWLTRGGTAFGLRTFVELLDRYERP